MLMGTMDSGQGHDVAYRQILSERMGIDADRIDMVQGDTDVTPVGFTGGSKSIPVGGVSLMFAADKSVAKMFGHMAAKINRRFRHGIVIGSHQFAQIFRIEAAG